MYLPTRLIIDTLNTYGPETIQKVNVSAHTSLASRFRGRHTEFALCKSPVSASGIRTMECPTEVAYFFSQHRMDAIKVS
jgi:hypothetical protein